MRTATRSPRHIVCGLGLTATLGVIAALVAPATARAYLDARTFEDDAVNGGGGGRLFTGAPADGYDCSVCHRGGEPLTPLLEGLPADGWEPGRTYVLTMSFPEGARNVGAVIEVANERGEGAGTLDGLASAELTAEDLCRGDAPAAHGVEVEGRAVARADVCGARRLAVRWTAPSTPVTSLRVFVSLVASDDSGDPGGDSTGRVASTLRARGEPDLQGGRLTAGCTASGASSAATSNAATSSAGPFTLVMLALGSLVVRRARASATRG
jgi:hypothetical protein